MLVHTPHLQDKYKGTRMILDMVADEPRPCTAPESVLIDHVEEHTVGAAWMRATGWPTLYPTSSAGTPQRAVDIVERFGGERICTDSAAKLGRVPAIGSARVHSGNTYSRPLPRS